MIGRTISHFHIVEKLGQGGMGVVYKAQDTTLDRTVALKFLPPHVGTEEEQKARFVQEAKAASAIDHENIASIYEIGQTDDGQMFIAMAYYEGTSLRGLIREGPLPIDRALDIAIRIGEGMAAAHERGIIHRDLKPENALVTARGQVKIIDFGLAKLTAGVNVTKSGVSVGTVAYMSPEQARGDEVSETTDIWSLGAILYEMLTGRQPFLGGHEAAIMYEIQYSSPKQTHELRSEIPPAIEQIVERALAKNSADRYQRMDEVVADLRSQLSLPSQGSTWELVVRDLRGVARRRRIPLAIGITLFVAIVGYLIYELFAPPTPSSSLNRSIAVLPFVNLADSSQEYLAAGLGKDLQTELAKLPDVLVISRQSDSLTLGMPGADSLLAASLGVRYLLKGEVHATVGRVRIRATVYDADRDKLIWDEILNRSRSDIVGCRTEILKSIVSFMDISSEGRKRFSSAPSPAIYEAYLRGLHFRDKTTESDVAMAIAHFRDAVRRDSMYVPALITLANTMVEQYRQGWERTERVLAEAEALLERASMLDTGYAQPLAVLGNISEMRGDRTRALSLLEQALEKNPNSAYTLTSLAIIYLQGMNEPRKGLIYLERVHELNPTDWLTTVNLAIGYMFVRDYPNAKRVFHDAARLNPTHEFPPYNLGYACERLGEIDSAVTYYQIALQNNPRSIKTYESLVSLLIHTRSLSLAESLLSSNMQYLQEKAVTHYLSGSIHGARGNRKRADEAYEHGLKLLEVDPSSASGIGDDYALAGLFSAQLGRSAEALQFASEAARRDSTNEEVMMKISRIHAIAGNKAEMLAWFRRAKQMNPEYDGAFLKTALDFEKYRQDLDLLAVAR